MSNVTQDRPSPETAMTDAIQEVCEQNRDAPEALWDALEAKGINATPGLIYQAFHDMHAPGHLPSGHHTCPPIASDGPPGLTAEDLVLLGQLAVKAGGVEQLVRILAVWERTPK